MSYDIAPSGLPRAEDDLRRLLLGHRPAEALEKTSPGGKAEPADSLLRELYRGILAHHAGQYEVSNRAFESALHMVEERYAMRVSRAALAMVTSDRALPYRARRSERLLIHYYGALNYLYLGNTESAAVEARRLSHFLEREQAASPELASTRDFQFFRLFAGTVFEAAREWNDAGVAYRNAGRLAPLALQDTPAPPDSGDVIVLVERGYVAHRVEQTVLIPLTGKDTKALSEGETSDRLAVAGLVAARVLAANLLPRDGIHTQQVSRTIHVPPQPGVKTEYLLRVSWPVLFRETRNPAPRIALYANGTRQPASFQVDVSEALARDMEAERSAMLARAIVRSATKFIVTQDVEERLSERNEGLGRLAGLLANIGGVLTEQADTRSWHLLPAEIGFKRLRLPAGSQQVTLEIDSDSGYGQGTRKLELAELEVKPGGLSVISTRIWN